MADLKVLWDVAEQQETGTPSSPVKIGVSFDNVIDTNNQTPNYSLTQFFKHYMDFMENADFIYYGAIEPKNKHVRMWIDTSQTNLDNLS